MRPSASDRFPTVWQWLIAGLVVVLLHALILRNLQLPASINTSKIINRIEVELSAPPRASPGAEPHARVTPKTERAVKPASRSPTRPLQRHDRTQSAEREPARIAPPVTPLQSMQTDETPSVAVNTPISATPPSEKAISPPESEALTAPRFNAAYLHNPTPVYPAAARRAGYEGAVVIRAHIQPDGSADRVEIKKSSGYAMLDQAALEAVRKWRFIPARRGNEAVAEWVEIPWTFKLEDE